MHDKRSSAPVTGAAIDSVANMGSVQQFGPHINVSESEAPPKASVVCLPR